MSRDDILKQLEDYWAACGGDSAQAIKTRVVSLGESGLRYLKEIACDGLAEVNTRKAAIVCIAEFGGSENANFLGKNFVFGKVPAQLYEAYMARRDWNGFPLYMQAEESIEKMGCKLE